MTTIENCRSCHSDRLKPILSLGDQYLSDFVEENGKPEVFPLDLVLCENCTLLQLQESAPAVLLYPESYGYRSGINQTMRDHLSGIVKEAMGTVDLQPGDTVIDIGSNDGTLLKNYPNTINRVGFDLLAKFEPEYEGMTFMNRPFDGHDTKAKIITAISCFYDLDDPNAFLDAVLTSLDDNGVFIVQQNYLGSMIRQTAFDNICHEHLEYYSLSSLEHLLKRHGLEVFRVEENELNGGSFRTYIRRIQNGETPEAEHMREREEQMGLTQIETYEDFSKNVERVKSKLMSFIDTILDQGKRIYIYGASTRGNTILQYCGISKEHVVAAAERNPEKWGKVIASSGIPIVSEQEARDTHPDYFLCLPWFFASEFIEREREYLDRGGSLIFPLPHPCVVTKDGITYL